MAEMPKPDNHLFCVSLQSLRLKRDVARGLKIQEVVEEHNGKEISDKAMESDKGGRAASESVTVQFLPWTFGENPNDTEENKTIRCPQIRKKNRGSTEKKNQVSSNDSDPGNQNVTVCTDIQHTGQNSGIWKLESIATSNHVVFSVVGAVPFS